MSDQRPPVEVREDEPGILEITCLDTLTKLGDSNGQGRLYWKMPRQDACDLAMWWRAEELDVKHGRKSIRDKRIGGLSISMSSSTMVNVSRYHAGRVLQIGYTLPREVPEYLANSELVTRNY